MSIPTFTERPAVGTRVFLEGCPGMWDTRVANQAGVVVLGNEANPSIVDVRFDNGERDYGGWQYLRPETSTSTTPDTITLNGKTYRLVPVEETPEPEPRRMPKKGEVWQIGPEACLITESGNVILTAGTHGQLDHQEIASDRDSHFLASSMKEAVEKNLLTPDLL